MDQLSGSYFGLSRDYNEFMIGGAPVLCAMLAALMRSLSADLLALLASVRSELLAEYAVPNAVWSLHLAASVSNDSPFEAASKHIMDLGGTNRNVFLQPEAVYGMYGDETWPADLRSGCEEVPSMLDFIKQVRDAVPKGKSSAVHVALRALVDDEYLYGPPVDLLSALAHS